MTKNGTGPLWVKCPDRWLDTSIVPEWLLPKALRLLRTARSNGYQKTPDMTIEEMAQVCDVKVRQMWNCLAALKESAPFVVGSHQAVYSVRFADFTEEDKPPGYCNALQYPSVVVLPDHDPGSKTHDPEQQPSVLSAGGVWGGRATDCTDSATDCTERLERAGILPAKAAELVRDYGVSSCYWHLRDWERRSKNSTKLRAGWLIRSIEGDWELLPEIQKRREQATGSRRYISGEYGEYIQH